MAEFLIGLILGMITMILIFYTILNIADTIDEEENNGKENKRQEVKNGKERRNGESKK